MSNDKIKNFADDLMRIGLRALIIQRFILRRAWGVYYAIWAISFTIFFFLPIINNYFQVNDNYLLNYIEYILALTIAGITTWYNFSKTYKILTFKKIFETTNNNKLRRKYWIFWLLYSIVLSIVIYYYWILSLLYISLLVIPIINLFSLKRTFDKIPFEGLLSNSSFFIACILSIVIMQYFANDILYAIWAIESFIWGFSGFYAIYQAHEEL